MELEYLAKTTANETPQQVQAAVYAQAPATKNITNNYGAVVPAFKSDVSLSYSKHCSVYIVKVQYSLTNFAPQNNTIQMSTGYSQQTVFFKQVQEAQGVLPTITIDGKQYIFIEQGFITGTPTVEIQIKKHYTVLPNDWAKKTAQMKGHVNSQAMFGFPAHQLKFQNCTSSQYPYYQTSTGSGIFHSGSSQSGDLTYKYIWRKPHGAITIPAAFIANMGDTAPTDWTWAANNYSWDRFYAKGIAQIQQADVAGYITDTPVAGVPDLTRSRKLMFAGYIRELTDANIKPL